MYAVELSKARSIERQQKYEFEEKRKLEELLIQAQNDRLEKEEAILADKKIDLNNCLIQADLDFKEYVRINGIPEGDGVNYLLRESQLSIANKTKQVDEDGCYRRYQ